MTSSCPNCNKTYANKSSLASHKSRYHKNEPDYRKGMSSSINENNISDSASDYSQENEGEYSHNTSDNDLSDAAKTDEMSTTDEDNNRPDKSGKGTKRKNSFDTLMPPDNKKVRRSKHRKDNMGDAGILATVLNSIKTMIANHKKQEDNPFNLLSSFSLRRLLNDLYETHRTEDQCQNLKEKLSDDEVSLMEAIINTGSLSDVCRLMNQSTELLFELIENIPRTLKDKNEEDDNKLHST